MSLTINAIVGGSCSSCSSSGGTILSSSSSATNSSSRRISIHAIIPHLPSLSSSRKSHITCASDNKFTSRTGKFDSRNRKNPSSSTTTTTTTRRRKERDGTPQKNAVMEAEEVFADDGFVMPNLPGLEKNFWEGPEWDVFGFVFQYLWAFGIGFALVACGIAVTTYNEGATDFKDTPAYKESTQTLELFDEPDASNSDVFESNPTEQAPSLE